MAADLEVPSVISSLVSTKHLDRTLVSPQQVPNHLTETRIFGKSAINNKLRIEPSPVLFEGYGVGKTHRCTLHIANTSTLNQSMHIIPPKTSFFKIKYSKKQSTLIPGLGINVVIEFKPTEWKHYYDCIRMHCQDERNILIPIHAYPVINTDSFPHSVSFDPTPVGQALTKTLSLKCDIPVQFEYKLSYLQSNPAFSIKDMAGVVPANGEVSIDVIFSPIDYSTAIMELKLEISQYNSPSKTCTFTGTSTPGLALKRLKLTHPQPPTMKSMYAHTKELYGQASVHKKLIRFASEVPPPTSSEKKDVYYEGILVPDNLDTPSGVANVLIQEAGKMKASQLKKVMSRTSSLSTAESCWSNGVSPRQLKQAAFLQVVETIANEERANHLRWATRLGEVPITSDEVEAIYQARNMAKAIYQQSCHHITIPEVEFARTKTAIKYYRTRRKIDEVPESSPPPTFDLYSNNPFIRRHMALRRFVQAGRKVIVRLRCQKRLKMLQKVTSDLKAGKSLRASLADIFEKKIPVLPIVPLLPLSLHHVSLLSFPKYTGHTPSCLEDRISDKPTDAKSFFVADVKKEMPLLDLKVPQQSELLGYSPVPLPAMNSYIPPGFPKPFASGAEDEFENLDHIPGVDTDFLTPYAFVKSPDEPQPNQESLVPLQAEPSPSTVIESSASSTVPQTTSTESSQQMVANSSYLITSKNLEKDKVSSVVVDPVVTETLEERVEDKAMATVAMPPTLLEYPDRDPINLLNTSPDATRYLPLLPYSEATLDHFLLPLPPYPTAKYPQIRPDPTDVIPGLMKWKQFPSPWLSTSESDKKLATLWKPSFSDLFSSDLLPPQIEHPSLLPGVQPDDYVAIDSPEVLPVPTMKMVNALFYIPDTEQQQQQEDSPLLIKPQASRILQDAQKDLEKHRTEYFNQLGKRIDDKLQSFLKQLDSDSS